MTVKLLTEHHFEFLSLKGGCTGPSESTRVKMLHCWESHVTAQLYLIWRKTPHTVKPKLNVTHWGICLALEVHSTAKEYK